MKHPLIAAILLSLSLAAPPVLPAEASTSNLEREKNWADQIVDFLIAGEPVWLQARGVKFLGLYTKPAADSSSAVILIHGRGVHPAWGFIDTLRVDLADAGWHTLSLQMPILEQDVAFAAYAKTFPEAFERLDAGIAHLRGLGVKRIVIIGHSSGAMTALAYAAERPKQSLAGVVGIGLSHEAQGGEHMQPARLLAQLRLPVLDLYGDQDLRIVLDTAAARRAAAAKAGNARYLQIREPGANHFFTERYDALKGRLVGWLKQLAGG